MTGPCDRVVDTFNLMPIYFQLPELIQLPLIEGNLRFHFLSIWDNHPTILNHPWAIRGLKGYSVLVFLQRKLKLWLLKKRTLSLHPLVPAGSVVLYTIFGFLKPVPASRHPILLLCEQYGSLFAIANITVYPRNILRVSCPDKFSRVEMYMINNHFTVTYNSIISDFAIPKPTPNYLRFQGFAR
jgi:hypothetical protein